MATPEHVSKLREGAKAWNSWRKQTSPLFINLINAKLSGADLSKTHLSGIDLEGADLEGAKLVSARLIGAKLSGARLDHADLSGADLSGAKLTDAEFFHANLFGAFLSGADLSGANLKYADLRGADLSRTNLNRAVIKGAPLNGTVFTEAIFGSTFATSGEQFTELKLRLSEEQFEGCIFDEELAEPEIKTTQEQNISPEIDVDPQSIEKSKPNTLNPVTTRDLIKQNLPAVRSALRFTADSLLAQLAEFRERVRSDNQLRAGNEEFHDELLQMLDQLANEVSSLRGAVSNSDGPATDAEVEETASWFDKFSAKSNTLLSDYADPEYAAERSVPLGIMGTCGAFGALVSLAFGSPVVVGLSAGALAGRFYIKDAKPGDVSKEVEAEFDEPDSPDS